MAVTPSRKRRNALLRRLGIHPTIVERLRAELDDAITDAEQRSPGHVTVLDAGCGHASPLARFRSRIDRLVGVDVHPPEPTAPYLDAFVVADLSGPAEALASDSFDLILSNFTLEHLDDPPLALANLRTWLRPGGRLILTTVNRRHPFVAGYLWIPERIRRYLQPLVKASAADAHRLVGRCNDPATIREALAAAGLESIRLETVGNLGRAWGRRLPTFAIGAVGDVLASRTPSRRSTILAVARKREAP